MQSAANRKSFRLYLSLGFRPVECTSAFFGTVNPDSGECAAFVVGISTDVLQAITLHLTVLSDLVF
jgi:hypothetical protein